jgi:hypothetical protein
VILKYDQSFEADSTSIDRVYYDSKNKILGIVFVNGNTAGYTGITPTTYEGFKNSSSAGRYYNSLIRGIYGGVRIDGVEPNQPVVTVAKNKFKVVAEVTGGVTLEVPATDLADALRVAEEQINKAFGGEVKISFKGVNVV